MPEEIQAPPLGAAVLDIGGHVGALLLHVGVDHLEEEIHVAPIDDPETTTHTVVRERPLTGGRTTIAALFPHCPPARTTSLATTWQSPSWAATSPSNTSRDKVARPPPDYGPVVRLTVPGAVPRADLARCGYVLLSGFAAEFRLGIGYGQPDKSA